MVSSIDISSFIKNAQSIGPDAVNELTKAIAQNPWCSANHILLAKAHYNEDSFLYNKFLKKSSVYVGDREVLFNLIHNQRNNKVELNEKETSKPAYEESSIVEETKKIEKPVEQKLRVETKPSEEVEEGEAIVIDEKTEATKITFDEIVEDKSDKPPTDKIDFDEIVQYNPLEELKDQVKKVKKEEKVDLPFEQVAYNPELELQKLIEEEEVAEETGEQDFLYWLNHIEDEQEQKKPEEIKHPDRVQNLLDQFLATKRKRPIKTREFYKAETKVEESETDNMDVLSETLINLYVSQGHFEKALAAYKKLSLQNPSKSAYFAALIRETEKKIK